MISSTREGEEFSDKPDNGPSSNPTNPDASSSSAWLRSKDPRIVRVSRAFGGKDRHSKVCTIRGLRDRRVRLTVPTALQLYDLQARLGLNQPSKVVDWLLNVAKDDIDELPPLQIPPGFNFIDQAHQAMLSTSSNRQELGSKMNPSWEDDSQKSNSLTRSPPRSTKSKHAVAAAMENLMWIKHMSGGEQRPETLESGHGGGRGGMQVGSSSDFIPRSNNHSTLPSFIQNVLPYGPYHHFDYPTNFSLSSPSSQSEDHHHHHHLNNFNLLHSGPPHVLVSPPAGMPSQSYFPTSTAAPMELDPRHFINHFQLLSPTQQQDMSLDDVSRSKR